MEEKTRGEEKSVVVEILLLASLFMCLQTFLFELSLHFDDVAKCTSTFE